MGNRIIVIGSGNHHNTLGVVRALGEKGYGVELITYDSIKKNYVATSKYVNYHKALNNIKELVPYLLQRQTTVSKNVIISCADIVTECLNSNLSALKTLYFIPGVPQEGKMIELMDKTTMIAIAAARGIYSPKVWTLPKDKEYVEYPCITKTHISSHGAKSDIVIIRNSNELNSFLNNNSDDVFAQAYIDKKEEVQFIGCSVNGGADVIIPGMTKIIRSQPNTNTGFLEYGPIDAFYENTVEKAKMFIKDCQYSGLFSFELIRDKNDGIWFLEVNFRNDGNAWCVTKAGINLPVIWVKSCMGEDYSSELREPNQIKMMPEFQDFKLVLQRKIKIGKWLKDWKHTDFFMEYDGNDPKPFWQYIKDKIR